MNRILFSTVVHAPVDLIWQLLMDKIHHPDKYINGVNNVEILEEAEHGILRRMQVEGMVMTEQITIEEGLREIRFVAINNEQYQGAVINRIEYPTPNGIPILDFIIEDHAGTPPLSDVKRFELIRGAVLQTKELAEMKGHAH